MTFFPPACALRAFSVCLALSATLALRAAPTPAPPLILISLDGFRADYCEKFPAETPHLRELMCEGVSARALLPVFPSNTFPNHYSIATGLYPSHHGIVDNHFFDPALGEFFHYNQAAAVRAGRWWGGEPIWITAVKQGRVSASSFWVGSEAEIAGARPTFSRPFDAKFSFDERLAEFAGWFALPAAQRPAIVALYLEETNSAGHKFGPDSPEVAAAVKLLDARVGAIRQTLRDQKIAANLLVVSDHGMTPISPDRVVVLDDYLDLAGVQLEFEGPVAGLRPLSGDVAPLLRALEKIPHATAYRAEDLPARFHITANPRNPPVWIVADEGWEVLRGSLYNSIRHRFQKGDHGFDPALASMHALFIAHGPSFQSDGRVLAPMENIHLYNLMCAALGLAPAPNDGDDRLVKAVLR